MAGALQGYGFSLWAVPPNHRDVKSTYNMKHMPHVTIETNMEFPWSVYAYQKCRVEFYKSHCARLPQMYKQDPLKNCIGFFCEVKDIKPVNVRYPHMTLFYEYDGESTLTSIPRPDDFEGTLYIADTRSLDPSDWHIVTPSTIEPQTCPVDV